MPDIYGPFDSASWSQDQWYRYSPTWAPSGVLGAASSATSPSAGSFGITVSGRDISVALGRAWVYGAGYERTGTPWTYSVPANTSSNPRMDALVLRRDLGAKTVLPVVLQGTPAATPVAPTRQQNETGQWDLPLFTWITPANSGAPLTSVTDNRVWVDTQSSNYAVFSAGSSTVFLRSKLAESTTTATTYTADPDLSIASLPVGLYALTAHLVTIAAPVANTNVLLRNATSTAVVVPYPLIGTAATSGGATPTLAFVADVSTAVAIGSLAQARRDWTGHLQVTTAGSFTVGFASGTSGSVAGLGIGSYLMLTKVA